MRTSTHIYKRTNIPDFQLCYHCKCLARYAHSPTKTSNVICKFYLYVFFLITPKTLSVVLSNGSEVDTTEMYLSLAVASKSIYTTLVCLWWDGEQVGCHQNSDQHADKLVKTH